MANPSVDMSLLEGGKTAKTYKQAKKGDPTAKAIDFLTPGSKEHQTVLEYLTRRLDFSERQMSSFYDRWRFNERRVQAYINLNDYEKLLKDQNDAGGPPKAVNIVVPYMYATIMTIVTYMVHTFCGRKPIFQVGGLSDEAIERAPNMEMLLQYNADHTRLVRHLYQFFVDQEIYGVGILLNLWSKESARRTVWKQQQLLLPNTSPEGSWTATKEMRTVYEGNSARSIDPFMFFPDPRVPISEVNSRGEFVFWRTFEGKHYLKRMEQSGVLKYVDAAGQMPRANTASEYNKSDRSIRSLGLSNPSDLRGIQGNALGTEFVQLDQGTVEINPSQLMPWLGDSVQPGKWIFTILNKNQIAQAEPYEVDHGKHPIIAAEPYTFGYGFGQLGSADFIGPYQDIISWYVNSHVENVRTALNNMFVVDPSRVEMQDLRAPSPGKIIRLKRAAYGQDVREILQQLAVQDVTTNHMRDLELFVRMADALTGVNDNLKGLQDSGGRKTATEVRTSSESGASRLASSAMLRSAQALVDLAEMMSLNCQQFTSEEFYITVMGMDGAKKPFRISPEHLTGDFYFPINDGSLPIDRTAQLDIWKEIFMGVAQDQQLRQQFDVVGLFEWLAELGGARNIDRFKLNMQPMPQGQVEAQAQQGNLVPVPQAGQGPSPLVNAVPQDPSNRAAGALQ